LQACPHIYLEKINQGGNIVKCYIEERTIELANYIIEHKSTVRETAKKFNISKSTVHKDITERLPKVNYALAQKARLVLDENKSERHIRGGLATKRKYSNLKKQQQEKIENK